MNKLRLYFFSVIFLSCSGQKKEYKSPAGYDLNKAEKFHIPDALNEISGISFYKGNNDTLYANQDEAGKLFYLHPGDTKATHVKFGKRGDYEDMAIINDLVFLLRSDGTLFSFPFDEVRQKEVSDLKEWKDLLPGGEYEGLYGDPKDNRLYVLCKQCNDDKTSAAVSAYILQVQPGGSISQNGKVSINVKTIEELLGKKKFKFHPSALSKDPQTQQWYILSSDNKILVIADDTWKVKEVYPLNPAIFRQPEGIAFDSEKNLYISNEGDDISDGNIVKFVFKKDK